MPGSTTTRDRRMTRDTVMCHIAFYWTESIGIPKLFYAAQWLAYANPLSTLRHAPHGPPRMTRGRCDSLRLHRRGLSPLTSCRSPGAPVHHINFGL
jgi:hypothetical protein